MKLANVVRNDDKWFKSIPDFFNQNLKTQYSSSNCWNGPLVTVCARCVNSKQFGRVLDLDD
jgi:hypothetical protein